MSAKEGIIASIVIPCYRRAELARTAVRSALAQEPPLGRFEVIVVDSSPDDEIERFVCALAPEAACPLYYFRKEAEGPGPSRNLGARASRGEFIAFLDSDCEADPGWLRAAVAAFEPGIGIVQGKTLPMRNRRQRIFTHTIRIESETFLYETANIIYRKAAFDAAGGFQVLDARPEAETPLGGEDVDLAWRVKRLGWKTRFCGEALVWHEVLPMKLTSWFWISRQTVFPYLVKTFPELRPYFFLGYFLDRAQACFTLLLAGAALAALLESLGAPLRWLGLLLAAPYVWHRASEPSRSLRGPLRLTRPLFYLVRDASTFLILAASSLRSRSLLL